MRLLPRHRPFRSRSSEGFTLVELMVVILIIAVLIGAAVPTFIGLRNRAHDSVARQALRNTVTQGRAAAVVEDSAVMFPGPASTDLVTALSPLEPAYEYTVGLSEGPQHISVNRMSGRVAAYAALSRSGTCWYAFDALASEPGTDVAPGTSWAYDDSDDAAEHCGTSNLDFDDIPDGSTEGDPTEFDRGDANGGDDSEGDPDGLPPGGDVPCATDDTCFIASAWGDPHIVTFDGLSYEFMAVGEYTLVKSLPQVEADGYPAIDIQIRTEPLADHRPGALDWVTVVRGVAADVAGRVVTVTFDASAPLVVDGSEVDLPSGATYLLDEQAGVDGGYVTRQGKRYRISWPKPADGTAPGFDVTVHTDHMNVNVFLPRAYSSLTEGVAGNPELVPNPYNDLMVKDQGSLPIPTSNHVIHTTQAASWAVTQADSLFSRSGIAYLGRDASFPGRYTDAENPQPPKTLDGFTESEIEEAQGACEAAVHPNLVQPCMVDYLAAGGELREEVIESALEATIPTLINAFDDWDEILTFEDGQLPNYHGWGYGFYSLGQHQVDRTIVDGALRFTRPGTNGYRYNRSNIVGEAFTFQADVKIDVTSRPPESNEYGVMVSSGDTYWWARVNPTFISDGNVPVDTTAKFVTNAVDRWAQIRIVKEGNTVTLFVDGQEAFPLTPAPLPDESEVGGLPTDGVGIGVINYGGGQGSIRFDNVAYVSEARGNLNMNTWAGAPWVQGVDFSDAQDLRAHGWLLSSGSNYTTAALDGAWYLEDRNDSTVNKYFHLQNTVVDDMTFQADLKVGYKQDGSASNERPYQTPAGGLRISDGNQTWWVSVSPTMVRDGNEPVGTPGKQFPINMADEFVELRIAKSGSQAVLYVDGEEAFELTGATADTWGNGLYVGMVGPSSGGQGRLVFDNVLFAPEDLGAEGTSPHVPTTWLYELTFDDDMTPTRYNWPLTDGSNISNGSDTGRWWMQDDNNCACLRSFWLPNTVTENFTYQAELQVGHRQAGNQEAFTATGAGLRLSDGERTWWVRIAPTHVADGNAQGVPDKTFITDAFTRAAQVRIVKTGATASLYVDGQYAFELTPAEAGTWANGAYVGFVSGSAGYGRLTFDNVKLAAKDLGNAGMSLWQPSLWVQDLGQAAALPDREGAWRLISNGNFSQGVTATGAWFLQDNNNSSSSKYFWMSDTVSTELTFQADLKVGYRQAGNQEAFTTPATGIRISDGTQTWWAQVGPTFVADGNERGNAARTVITNAEERFTQVRLVKDGSQVALYVDGRFAFNLTPAEAGSWANGIYVGMPASSPGFGRLEFDNLRIAPKATTFGLVEWLPQPWAQRLTFDDQLNPNRRGWALKNHGNLTSGYDTSTGSWYVSDNNNSADTEYSYMTGAVATSITFSADVKTEQKPGQSFTQGAGIRISDGQTEYLVKLSLDSIQDGHGSASVAVDLAGGFHNIRITKGPSGATLIVDGVEAFDLTGVSTSANELAFGVVASSAGQGLVYFDNVTVGP